MSTVPLPAEAMLRPSGLALAAATTSARLRYGASAATTSTIGCAETSPIGAKSFSGSNGSFAYSAGLIARLAVWPMAIV